MLTVIIYRKSSQEFIDKYRSLFEIYCDAGKIAFCFWNEQGTDWLSALPQLPSIVRGERKWKAIVALPLDDTGKKDAEQQDSQLETKADNPFDYLCNSDPEPPVKESDIPLIRLAQMLGGVPLANHYHEQQEIWDELNDKYSTTVERPSYLYLLKARVLQEIQIPTVTDIEMQNRHECDSSMFWYRNRYPAKARFLVQDCSKCGNAHFREDQFSFWMTVLMLALNDLPTGTLEAYKVYNVKSIIDWEKMHHVFSDYYNRLDGARSSALKQIMELKKTAHLSREMDGLPPYQVEVPVDLKVSQEKDIYIDTSHIGLTGDCPVEEGPWFYRAVQLSIRGLNRIYRSVRLSLDRACISARFSSKVLDEEIVELDEYQFNELDEVLSEKEKEILIFNTYVSLPLKMCKRELDHAKKQVAANMEKRMYRRKAVVVGSLAIVVYFIGFLPNIIYQIMEGNTMLPIAGMGLIGCLIIFLVCLVCLLCFRYVIKRKIQNYNEAAEKYSSSLEKSKSSFSKYLSEVSSYMRGRYMLQALEQKTVVSNAGIVMFSRHIEHLRTQMDVIMNWLKDFERSPMPDMGEADRSYMDFDFEIPPEKNREYFLQLDQYDLSINAFDGGKAIVPYPFVTGFEVRRERLYDKPSAGDMTAIEEGNG